MWHTFWHSIWPLRSSGAHWVRRVPGWGPAVLTELGRSQVEVQRCPSWGPAVPTACGSWRGCKGGGGEAGGEEEDEKEVEDEEEEAEEENNCDKILQPSPGRWEKKCDLWASPYPTLLDPTQPSGCHPCWPTQHSVPAPQEESMLISESHPNPLCWPHPTTRGEPTWTKTLDLWVSPQCTVLEPTQVPVVAPHEPKKCDLWISPLNAPCLTPPNHPYCHPCCRWWNAQRAGFWSQEENILIPESHPPPTVFNHPWWPHMNKKNVTCESHPSTPCLTPAAVSAAIRADPLNMPCGPHRSNKMWFVTHPTPRCLRLLNHP